MVAPRHDTMLGYLHPYQVEATFHKSLFDLFGYDMSHEGRIKHWVTVRAATMGIPEARNKLCKEFLASDCEWLFQVDTDMGFEMFLLDQLLAIADAEKRPVVGGLAFTNRESLTDGRNGFRTFPSPTIMDYWEHSDGVFRFTGRTHYPINTLTRVGSTGAACLVIHRSVVERMHMEYGENWFSRLTDAGGAVLGEDISFCDRCRLLDIPVYVHTGIRTTHFKHIWLGEDDFWNSFLAPPAEEPIDVIVPVLNRPQNVRPLMVTLRASTGLATAWFVVDPDDEEEAAAVRDSGGRLIPRAGTFSAKVNHAFRYLATPSLEPAPWLLLVGDDVRFRPGWLDHAQDVARRYHSTVVGTNDLLNPRVIRGEHATHPVVSRKYIEEQGSSWDGPGVVCHEGYHHWCVDDEIVSAAKMRGLFQAAHGSEVEHLHPLNGGAPMDHVYELGEKHKDEDVALYGRRLAKYTGAQVELPNRAARRAAAKLERVK